MDYAPYGERLIEKDMPYLLASEIKRHCPNNSIDWQATFFHDEKHYYLERAFRNLIEGDSPVDKVYNQIYLARELSSDETHSKLHHIAKETALQLDTICR